jgi:uncharacterized protein
MRLDRYFCQLWRIHAGYRGLFVGFALLGMAVGTTYAQTGAPAKAAPSIASPAAAADYDPTKSRAVILQPRADNMRALLWEVQAKSGGNKVYLFGTIHVGKASFYPLPIPAQSAFLESAKIVVEADVGDQSQGRQIAELIDYPRGETLATHLSPALITRLKVQLEKRRINYANVAGMRPVMLGGMLPIVEYVKLGYDMANGLDLHLIERAKREQKTLLFLETPIEQIKLLTSMPPSLQEAFLENTLAVLEQERSADQVTGIVNAWQLGDAKLMAQLADENGRGMREVEKINQVLLYGRHPAMLSKVEAYLASGEIHFVAVGSLHLVGAKGLVNLLAEKGYKIRQL